MSRLRFEHFDFLAPVYDRVIRPAQDGALLNLLEAAPGHRILDAAGGTGRSALGLEAAVVSDLSLPMLRQAQKRSGLQPACAAAETLPFPSNTFDRVLMVDALHHVIDQPAAAGELLRVLRPGGRLVIEEPDIRSFYVRLIALGEKLAGMRSHFLDAERIAALFPSGGVRLRREFAAHTLWVVVEKLAQG